MSLITYRVLNERGQPTGYTYYLEFDAATVEQFTRTAAITEYPVETGAILSDHYQPQPRSITLEGVVSDTPARFYVPLERKINAAPPPIVTPLILGNVIATLANPRANRVTTFFGAVDWLIENRVPVNVVILKGVEFRDMFITDVRAPRLAGTGGSVTFSLDLRQIVVANPAETVTAAQERTEAEVQQSRALGKGSPKPVEDNSLEAQLRDRIRNQAEVEFGSVTP